MRSLVLGAHGMLGHVVVKTFQNLGHDVVGVALEAGADTVALDVAAPEFDHFLNDNQFDVVINCIGILNQFAERNPDLAIYLNSYLPHKLEKRYALTSTKIIQPSTDCVFAGNTGPYTEDSLPDGRTFYDRSKALGELVNDKDVTLRMSIVGPDINENGIGLLHWFLRQTGEVGGFTHAMWTGITTVQLAKGMVFALERDLCGLFHYVPKRSISKYDMLREFARVFGKDDVVIVPKDEPRIDKSLRSTRMDFGIPDYPQMFDEMKQWMQQYAQDYPWYAHLLERDGHE